jgi:hypothetical protein
VYRPKLCRRLDTLRKKLEPLGYDVSRLLAVETPVLRKESRNIIRGERLDINLTVPRSKTTISQTTGAKRKRGEVEDQKQLKLPLTFIKPPPPSTGISMKGLEKVCTVVGKVRGFGALQGK